jgi:hypothetical protein
MNRSILLRFFVGILLLGCFSLIFGKDLEVFFDGKFGQIEVGGKYAGVEFHHSRPLPSRISFYYPVANSLDLSTDYWKRDESMPFSLSIEHSGKVDSIGYQGFAYRYTPYSVTFKDSLVDYDLQISYDFCDDVPVMVYSIILSNISENSQEFKINTGTKMVLRTCQTYVFKSSTTSNYLEDIGLFTAHFDYLDTDSSLVFISNAGEKPNNFLQSIPDAKGLSSAQFAYSKVLRPKEEIKIIQLIGSCANDDENIIVSKFLSNWNTRLLKYEDHVENYALRNFPISVGDSIIEQTAMWSKAVLGSNIHYLDGKFVPMPCPAEYNFFFTHDALLTNLGAVYFDLERVKNDLLYLKSLTKQDSILPHAYYWKDGRFMTEYCGSDNWNHFWFIILANSYLKHSGDTKTVELIYPIIHKSISLVMRNKFDDDLLYGTQPDWWDIGHVFGARSYITLLMIKALQDYAAISFQLSHNENVLPSLNLAYRMRSRLVDYLWKDDKSYLMNMLDTVQVDNHYYAGSLVAAAFDILDNDREIKLLKTAREQLMDENLGIRNAMPADFHKLVDVYQFKGGEMGEPYIYANGGIWPQGTIWYGLGLLNIGRVDEAKDVLTKYLTLEGIKNSPNGQPSFYEYRNADANSTDYGKIDKPTFLWAGGWYLYTLYQLMGVRENPWNIWFEANLPEDFTNVNYPLTVYGKETMVKIVGTGQFFKSIKIDGQSVNTAVVNSLPKIILLERGNPEQPYLEKVDCILEKVNYSATDSSFQIYVHGVQNQPAMVNIISPYRIKNIVLNGKIKVEEYSQVWKENAYRLIFKIVLPEVKTEIDCHF